MSFDSFGLLPELVRVAFEKGYHEPTPIQNQAIPVILKGRDILGGAQTGTGKTAAFTLPLLHLLSKKRREKDQRHVRALILTPTRELAAQVAESVHVYGKYLSLKSAVIFGGVKIHPQIVKLRRGVDILIATPGRLLDHVNQKSVDLSKVDILVLDEADRMLDMGFIHDIRKLLKLLPRERQNLLFSATFSDDIKKFADNVLNSPVLVEVARRNTSSECVEQRVYHVDSKRKRELLSHLIISQNWQQVLVFTRTKHGANRLVQQLEKDGISTVAIHGNKSQGARTSALSNFKGGSIRVLVATDIAARGLDIHQLPHVVNFELPNAPEDYVHRIGRTGRAGNKGVAISLVCVDERKLLRGIEKLMKRELTQEVMPGYEPDPSIKPEPIQNGRGVMKRCDNRGNSRSRGRVRNGASTNNKPNAFGRSRRKSKNKRGVVRGRS